MSVELPPKAALANSYRAFARYEDVADLFVWYVVAFKVPSRSVEFSVRSYWATYPCTYFERFVWFIRRMIDR